MKFDMHCHTKEGSIDGQIPIEKYISILEEKGFHGMLVSDHDSYNGYRHWKKTIRDISHKDFVVLKGIEYDTIDAGHMLIIMPCGVKMKLLELRGLPLGLLIDIVHRRGGIIGPAHPCGGRYLSFTNTRKFRKSIDIISRFDFLESFNACETEASNNEARRLAEEFALPGFGGSDAHRPDCVGLAYTQTTRSIVDEDDFINYVKSGGFIHSGGTYYHHTAKKKMGKAGKLLELSFWFYNHGSGLFRQRKRTKALHVDDAQEVNYYDSFRKRNQNP